MKKNFLYNLQKESDNYSKGIDYLRLIIKEYQLEQIQRLIDKMDFLDFDNSNTGFIDFKDHKLTCIKIQTPKGIALICNIIYNGISIPIFSILRYTDNIKDLTKTWGKIDYYGLYYRLLEIGIIYNTKDIECLQGFISFINNDLKISRLDYRYDFFYKNKTKIFIPKDITKLRSNSKVDYKVVGGQIQSWILGNRQSKRYLIRGYDKLADTSKKGKFSLYKDYYKYEDVYRLEFEFLNHFCKKFTYNTIEEFISYIDRFLDYDKSIGSIFESTNNVKIGEVKDRYKYADSTKGYMKGCIETGINIFGLLKEVFEHLGKSKEEIEKIFLDFLKREKYLENMVKKEKDLFYNK